MHPVEILRVKQVVLRSTLGELVRPVSRLLRLPEGKKIRAELQKINA
jgi:hypothetical protein